MHWNLAVRVEGLNGRFRCLQLPICFSLLNTYHIVKLLHFYQVVALIFVLHPTNFEDIFIIKRCGTTIGGRCVQWWYFYAFLLFEIEDLTSSCNVSLHIRKATNEIDKSIGKSYGMRRPLILHFTDNVECIGAKIIMIDLFASFAI